MSISQMQASYHAEQDRVLLNLHTRRHESLRFAFTRRVCREVLESMEEILALQPVLEVSDNSTRIQRSDQEKQVMDQFAVETKYPLGKKHLLVLDYQLLLEDDSLAKVRLRCESKKEIEFQLDFSTFQDLLSLMAQVIEDADWGLIDVASRDKFIHNSPNSGKLLH